MGGRQVRKPVRVAEATHPPKCQTRAGQVGGVGTREGGMWIFGSRRMLALTGAVLAVGSVAVGSVAAPARAAEPVPPSAPSGVVATPGNARVVVTWDAVTPPSGETITDYVVTSSAGTSCARDRYLACPVTGLQNGVRIAIRVRAAFGSVLGPYSAAVEVIPGVPTAPTGVSASAGPEQATVSFVVPAANGSPIVRYWVIAHDPTDPARGHEVGSGTTSPVTVTGLSSRDTYTFTVKAANAVGTSAPSTPSPPVTPGPPSLDATGSSFASVAIQEWVGQTSTLYGLDVNWQATSSIIGLNDFATNQVDFAASDIPYSSGQAAQVPNQPYQYLPDLGAGLGFMYNLDGNNGQRITNLILDPAVIDRIFLGKVTHWDDPSIAAINPQLPGDLPSTPITPVYRSDAGGENYLLSEYLLSQDTKRFVRTQSDFSQPDPGQPSATWPTPPQGFNFATHPGYPGWKAGALVGQSGSDNAADYVAAPSSLGAITYVETAYAREHDFPVASVVNASGAAVQPTSPDVATALQGATLQPDLTENLSGVFTDPSATAYPLSSDSYLVVPCSPARAAAQGARCDGPDTASTFPAAKGEVLGQFVSYLACAGQEQMATLGYSPLPPNQVQQDFDAVGRITGGVEPPPPTAANCPNPTVTGQVPLQSG